MLHLKIKYKTIPRFKDVLSKPNEKEIVIIKKNKDNIKKEKKQHKSTDVNKIINLKKDLQDRFRNTVVKQKHVVEEQEKNFGPIINALKNVNTKMNEVKDVPIKTEGDIQKLNIPYYYQPRNPELKRLISSEETPKHSQKSTTNSPLPKGVINLCINATKYLPTTQPNNCFEIYYDKDFDDYKIGKNDDFKNYKQILIETDSIYQNNDKSTGRAKSSGGAKYVAMISKIWKEINENKKNKRGGLKKYTEDCVEYHIRNVKQLTDRLQFISAEERAGNNNFHNEKLGILHLFKTIMENIIDTPEGLGTKLEKNKKPKNKLDEAAREHDYFYKYNKDTKTRHVADKVLEQKAMERFYDLHSSLAITTATALAEGVSAVYSAVTDAQHKKQIEQETIKT
ncbi:hypothetical protein QTP88_001875 [Uroleucon formosanum]